MHFIESLNNYCDSIKRKNLLRDLSHHVNSQNALLNFTTNDYLGLSQHPKIISAACLAAQTHGVGATGSRLLSGNHPLMIDFEAEIAANKNTQAALIFNSGFQANISVLSALADKNVHKKPVVLFFDKLNHASLYQGAFLSGAEIVRYHHNDTHDLESKLKSYGHKNVTRMIVSETVFGMDGDIADAKALVDLAYEYDCFLYLDEAHATGVFGNKGYGISTSVDMSFLNDYLIMGTFSKALGTAGAYIACPSAIKDYLVNRCQGFIFSTAPSPMTIAAAAAGWHLLPSLQKQRDYLQDLAFHLRKELIDYGYNTGLSTTHIIPLIIGDNEQVQHIRLKLQEQGIVVSAVRPPTVPPGTARLRIALTCNHNQDDIALLLEKLKP